MAWFKSISCTRDDVKRRSSKTRYATISDDIGAYLFKARIVVPEIQPLLENGSETIFVPRQRNKTRHPLLCSRFLISNRRPLLGNDSVNTFPLQRIRIQEWTVLSEQAVPKNHKSNGGKQVSSVWESVKKGNSWKEMTGARKWRNNHC
jgi:hypothetical protein